MLMTELSSRTRMAHTFERHLSGVGRFRRARSTALLVADLGVLLLTALLAMLGRDRLGVFRATEDVAQNVLPVAALLVGLWIVALAFSGAYQWKRIGFGTGEFTAVVTGSLVTAGLAGAAAYLASYDLSRGFFVLAFAIGTPLLLVERFVMRKVINHLRTSGVLTTSVLLAGVPSHVDALAAVLNRSRWLGYEVIGALTNAGDEVETPHGLPVVGTLDDVAEVATASQAEVIIFTEGAFPKAGGFNRLARQMEDHHAQLVVVPALTDISAQRMNMRPVAGLPLVFVESPGAAKATRWAKRTFDVVGSSLALLVAGPVMGLIALAIKLEDRGPVLFDQVRAGLKGEPFSCFKFRSMVIDAEERLAELRRQNQSGSVLFKMKDDPRITRVGRFIRRFSLDELPQLVNVLRGDMSLVGPRPALPSEVAQYQRHVHRRLDVRPGLTGLWQVSGRSDLSWDDTVRLDLYYVDNWSLMQDLAILSRTVGAVLRARGAY